MMAHDVETLELDGGWAPNTATTATSPGWSGARHRDEGS